MKKKSHHSSSKRPPHPLSPKPSRTTFDYILMGMKQILVALVAVFLIYNAYNRSSHYQWVCEVLLKKNYQHIQKNPDLTVEELYEQRIGFGIAYLRYVRENTPDTAVILFPPAEVLQATKDPSQDLSALYGWAGRCGYYRFLAPRRIVFPSEEGHSPYYDKITHVAIINGWGIDKLPYALSPSTNNTILPIQPPSNF